MFGAHFLYIQKEFMNKKITRIAIVLDSSGSMGSIREHAVNNFNEQVQEIRNQVSDNPELETYVSLITFGSKVDVKMDNLNPDYIKELTPEEYIPGGMTALYDAINTAIQLIEPKLSFEDAGLVVVITDGGENSSSPINREYVPKKIKELQTSEQWTFTYMCTEQDLAAIEKTLGAHTGNTFVSSFTEREMKTSGGIQHKAMYTNYFGARVEGARSVTNAYTGDSDPSNLPSSNLAFQSETTQPMDTKQSSPRSIQISIDSSTTDSGSN